MSSNDYEVIAVGQDEHGSYRDVKLPDGTRKRQRPNITVEREIRDTDGKLRASGVVASTDQGTVQVTCE